MLSFDLSEMRRADGSVLYWEAEAEASRHALKVADRVAVTAPFRELLRRLPSKRLLLYCQYAVKEEIYPFVRQACVIRWYRDNGRAIPSGDDVVPVPRKGLCAALEDCWEFDGIPLRKMSPFEFVFRREARSPGQAIRQALKPPVKAFLRFIQELRRDQVPGEAQGHSGTIACHYVEGVDPSRRNDLSWFAGSGLEPEQVLIYFDSRDNKTGRPIPRKIIRDIEERGFRWVALLPGVVEEQGMRYWNAPRVPAHEFLSKRLAGSDVERWAVEMGNHAIEQVFYWRSFHRAFGVKVHYIPEEGFAKNIAQAIAFDAEGTRAGVLVGRQRSEISAPLGCCIGFQPKHVYFVWSRRYDLKLLHDDHDRIEALVVSGYPYCTSLSYEDRVGALRRKGVTFVVALFDEGHGPHTFSSSKNIERLYRAFLQWVVDDPEVGLIIKSKKPSVIKGLPALHPLLDRAVATGRCVRPAREWGMFPAEASKGADMAVGVDIATAVVEAVLNGCRGVCFDAAAAPDHQFYQWGRVIYASLEEMVAAMKRFKADTSSEPSLGDWSAHLNELDPFRDGQGGARMGSYMRWLLESFNDGKSREEAIRFANGSYAAQWGADKVIMMDDECVRNAL